MNKKLLSWINDNGRKFIELRLKGGDKLLSNQSHNLTQLEINEFLFLYGQFKGILYLLEPQDAIKCSKFHREINRKFKKLEQHCKYIFKLTGNFTITRTIA